MLLFTDCPEYINKISIIVTLTIIANLIIIYNHNAQINILHLRYFLLCTESRNIPSECLDRFSSKISAHSAHHCFVGRIYIGDIRPFRPGPVHSQGLNRAEKECNKTVS